MTSSNPGTSPAAGVVEGGRGGPASAAASVSQRLVIERFPPPHIARALSPNGRAHWTTQREAKDVVRAYVFAAVREAQMRALPNVVIMQPIFIYPVKRKRDDDNLATGVLKAVRDALVRMGILAADDIEHLRQLPVEVRVEKGRRALILEFTSEPLP